MLNDVAAELTFTNRLHHIQREFTAEQYLKFQLQRFAVDLLGALFSFSFEFFNRSVHPGNLRILLRDLRLKGVLGFLLRLDMDFSKGSLHALFDV